MRGPDTSQALISALRACRRRIAACALVNGVLRALPVALVAFVAAMAVDFEAGLFEEGRLCLLAAVIALPLAVVLWTAARISLLSLSRTARIGDRAVSDRRRRIQTALELSPEQSGAGDAHGFLIDMITTQGAEQIRHVPWSALAEPGSFRRSGRRTAVLGACLLAALVAVPAVRTHALRVLRPHADVPPYTRYRFAVSPDPVQVVYGGTVALSVHVRGAPLRAAMQLVTRTRRGRFAASCFQESQDTFSQRIENVSEPLRVCFRTGRARSRWHRVALLEEPRIANVHGRLVAPAYSGLPTREFTDIPGELKALRGSTLTLTVTSNRELLAGAMQIEPGEGPEVQTVQGVVEGRRASLSTSVVSDAVVTVTVTGPGGLNCPDPLRFALIAVPDRPPAVALDDMASFMMATPSVRLDLGVRADDDLGVSRVDLFRTLAGYRDRAQTLAQERVAKDVSRRVSLDLPALGVIPGDVLELFAEARDTNPSLTGVGTCQVHRVRIISEERYAAMLRAETAIAEFLQRFRRADEAMQRLAEAFDHLEQVLGNGPDAATAREAYRQLLERLRRARAEIKGLSQDFPIYELEAALQEVLKEAVADLEKAEDALGGRDPLEQGFRTDLAGAREALFARVGQIAEQRSLAEEVALVARVMQLAGEYLQIIDEQDQLVRQLSRYEHAGLKEDPAYYRAMAARQRDMESRLTTWCAALNEAADNLSPKYGCLAECSREFSAAVSGIGVNPAMLRAARAADAGRGRAAYAAAEEALRLLRSLLLDGANCPSCAGHVAGNCLSMLMAGIACVDGDIGLNLTLEQMLNALCRRPGSGPEPGVGAGGGSGSPTGGDANDGYSMRDIPVLGPHRERPAGVTSSMQADDAQRGGEDRFSTQRVAEGPDGEDYMGQQDLAPAGTPRRRDVPPRYREAVRRFLLQLPVPASANPRSRQ